MRRIFKIVGVSVASILVVVCAYFGLLSYPSVLFANHTEYKNFRVHSEIALPIEQMQQTLDAVNAALATSEVHDPTMAHDIFFGDGNRFFSVVQDIAWWIGTRSGRPVFTYSRAVPPLFSHLITFRVPDFERDLLVHPEARFDMGMTHDLIHEATHSLVTARVGAAAPRLPEWKREGFAEYVASSLSIFSDRNYELARSVERVLDEDLSKVFGIGENSSLIRPGCQLQSGIQDEAGHRRPACYYISRVLVEYLVDVKGLSVDELMAPGISPAETLRELIGAHSSGQL